MYLGSVYIIGRTCPYLGGACPYLDNVSLEPVLEITIKYFHQNTFSATPLGEENFGHQLPYLSCHGSDHICVGDKGVVSGE